MKQSILNLGKVLSRKDQQQIKAGNAIISRPPNPNTPSCSSGWKPEKDIDGCWWCCSREGDCIEADDADPDDPNDICG